MNKKKVDSILKGITAAGIAMGGVSSIQGADMVMAAINESAADSNSLVDAGSLSESERTEYSESTTQSMSESASESTSESESVSVSESESTSESSSISESAKQSDAEQQSGDNVVAAAYTDDAEQDTAVYARMSGMPQLASNDTNRDDCVSDQVHHVTKITASNFKDLARSDVQSKGDIWAWFWENGSCQYRVVNSYTGKYEYFNDFDSVTFNWTTGRGHNKQSYSKTGELYICDGNAFVLKVSDNEWVEFRSSSTGGVHTYKYAYKHGDSIDLLDDADPNYEKSESVRISESLSVEASTSASLCHILTGQAWRVL